VSIKYFGKFVIAKIQTSFASYRAWSNLLIYIAVWRGVLLPELARHLYDHTDKRKSVRIAASRENFKI
jgi:hypothetical protein